VLNQQTCAHWRRLFFRTQIRKTVVKTKKTEPLLPCLIATGHDFSGMSGSMCSMLAMGSMGATSQRHPKESKPPLRHWRHVCGWTTLAGILKMCQTFSLTLDGYFSPLVFWYQWDYLRSPAKKACFRRVSTIGNDDIKYYYEHGWTAATFPTSWPVTCSDHCGGQTVAKNIRIFVW